MSKCSSHSTQTLPKTIESHRIPSLNARQESWVRLDHYTLQPTLDANALQPTCTMHAAPAYSHACVFTQILHAVRRSWRRPLSVARVGSIRLPVRSSGSTLNWCSTCARSTSTWASPVWSGRRPSTNKVCTSSFPTIPTTCSHSTNLLSLIYSPFSFLSNLYVTNTEKYSISWA